MVFLDSLSLYSGGARSHLKAILSSPGGPSIKMLTTRQLWREIGARGGIEPLFAPEKTRSAIFRAAWRKAKLRHLVRESRADVYFDPAGGAPALPVPRVTMVRNMLPFDPRISEWYGTATYQGQRLRALKRRALSATASAEGVIFISEWSKATVVGQLGRDPRRSCVIPHGVAHQQPAPFHERPLRLLCVSDFEPYKRQLETAMAYDSARACGAALGGLVMAGAFTYRPYESSLRRAISRLRYGPEIELAGWLGRAELMDRMRGADALVFSSSVECCPNILLECLSAGKPVVCSDAPPMPEFAEDAPIYVDSTDPVSIRDGLRRLARMSLAEREELGKKGMAVAQRYDWEATADRTWRFVADVARDARARAER